LDNAKNLFNQFKGSPNNFQTDDLRCKLQTLEKFESEKYWIIDRWWGRGEKEKLGIIEKEEIFTIDEFKEEMRNIEENFDKMNKILGEL